jgi:hypothetical protein
MGAGQASWEELLCKSGGHTWPLTVLGTALGIDGRTCWLSSHPNY